MPAFDPATHPDTAHDYQKALERLTQPQPQQPQPPQTPPPTGTETFTAPLSAPATAPAHATPAAHRPVPLIDHREMDYFETFELAADAILVGDCHLTRGDITVIGGVPGCGKSRLLVSLAIAGMRGPGALWMGLPVHSPFQTSILQAENGDVRLKRELGDIRAQGHRLDGWLTVTSPPRCGLAFANPEFRAELRDWLAQRRPGIFAIDPWNRATQDDKAKDYRATLDQVMEVLPAGPDKPALVIVHHLRKQATGEQRKRGRELLNELSGSYVIGSAPRVTFILEPATPDPDDDRVIFTCAKNNNGDMGKPTAWHRRNGLFEPCPSFDWAEWEGGSMLPSKRQTIELQHLATVFDHGKQALSRAEAVVALQTLGFSKSYAYDVLHLQGKFQGYLSETGGVLAFCSQGPKDG